MNINRGACVVDTNAAGNGNLEVSVTNPAGSTMYNYVRQIGPTIFGVFFTPAQSGMHLVNVSFNGEVVCGLSFSDFVLPCTFDLVSVQICVGLVMVALCNTADHYIFALLFLSIYLLFFLA